ncbi:PREDICTED: ubiquitin carboxyl-terminal hydrolase 35-like isoform X1 [Papilio polytes]|uniref:ubiquitin carboxyl-terminal hydrolase 35-like isoform X1 n=1 Tax=Papilio polytes TaxID=76194 RepID=UPI0006766C9D|nr:PREDICTED: ubiquitin carboxyl-terminal hydrolase 35-like isoform X1 [Papilio polytes]XP_013137923.1 PREDICTED: ubiquitin carboxyl-terminal hydrolase 35-like isoform X1 [Papilio polytes]
MVVKNREVVDDNPNQLDLNTVANYIRLMDEQPDYVPPAIELIDNCVNIVTCLSQTAGTEDQLWGLLTAVENYLVRLITSLENPLRSDLIDSILDKFFSIVSDPTSDARPAMSVILIVLDGSEIEAPFGIARWLEDGPTPASIGTALNCLYRWITEWNASPALSDWVLGYMKKLEENEQYDVLIEISKDNLSRLLLAVNNPTDLRQSNAEVIFHVMASLRETDGVLDKVTPYLGEVLNALVADSRQWSWQLLQNVVDITTAMVDHLRAPLSGQDLVRFNNRYSGVIACLEHHMASRSSQFLRLPAWGAAAAAANDLTVGRKVGLLNRGNTCYVNSVMQALLATRGFSNYVVLHMNDRAYWAKLAELFAKMKYSVSTKVDPSDFYETMNSMKFDMHIQHDTSEFLGYFFDLLLSYERRLDIDHDYSQPPIIMTFRRRLPPPLTLSNANHDDNFVRLLPIEMSAPADDEPVAGSSTGITASRKRTRKGYSYSRKRQRTSEPPPIIETRDSFVDHIFGGVILSRTRCLICSRMSTTRDVFRDLTLAFPEANKDHVHTIQSLVDYYCSTELLTADNRYKCPACGCKRDVERRAVIEYTPRYLIIVLKNFKFDMKKLTQNKLMSNTVYCHSVSLPTVPAQTQNVYTMYAAIVHEGSSMSSGHYYTLAKTEDGWHLFNDDTVTKCNEDQIQFLRPCNTPYMLFYRRNDVPDIPFPLLSEIPANIKDKVKAHNKQYIETVQKIQMTRP